MHFPSVILADRGEMESRTADLLCKHLGIAVENAPPYRGDLKGIIEKHFSLNHKSCGIYSFAHTPDVKYQTLSEKNNRHRDTHNPSFGLF